MKKMRKLTHGTIAQALGLSARYIRRLRAAGMPCTSIEAARRWHAENIGGGSDGASGLNQLRGDFVPDLLTCR
jgi:hypothetical protein